MLKIAQVCALLLGGSLLVGCARADAPATPEPTKTAAAAPTFEGREIPAFNRVVLETIAAYPTDGTHDYFWPKGSDPVQYDGVTEDLFFKGVRVMKGEPQRRSYCCGITLEVFLRSYEKWTASHGAPPEEQLTPETWRRFQRLWFVEKLNGPGPSAALEQFGLGRTVPLREALPGDFVQLWRTPKEGKKTGSGHSVVFLDWVRDEKGAITGMKYWSSNQSTKGIAPTEESFSTVQPLGGLAEEFCYAARVEVPSGK